MDEAYKILPKDQHEHWDKFKKVHGEKIVNFVRSRLGEKENKENIIEIFIRLTRTKKGKRRYAKRNYEFLKKYKWIK